ncbi:hypothetical protein [Amycolatopsis dendrobii]|uniref:Uncharacterized protein n=1 Tax=Amycolatopsis dendrobii TaxID=2760662 RepID=A0A7W3VST0_9PSEU|nr:hypothetical protein [Amycolatopsis dendrobii]MBB1152470.1 hypothetical protein [Amycolatopsis dendrobii]
MPRTRYTRLVHKQDEARLNHQIRALNHLAYQLRRRPAELVELAAVIDLRDRRRARLEQQRRHKLAPSVTAAIPLGDHGALA